MKADERIESGALPAGNLSKRRFPVQDARLQSAVHAEHQGASFVANHAYSRQDTARNRMHNWRFFQRAALVMYTAFPCGLAVAADSDSSTALVAEARELLDTYYGSRENLRRAGVLLNKAMARNEKDADAYVQAARLAVLGGHIVRYEFVNNTIETYHAFLDRALAIDPENQKAYILKAEAYDIQRDYRSEKKALDQARELGESDPWLWMGYGRYYGQMGDSAARRQFFSKVQALGPGKTNSQRKAYVSALNELALIKPAPGEPSRLKELASEAWRERYPTDAWTLGNFADIFAFHAMFDDAIIYAREALRTMNYGAGRLTLAVSLYGKAAQLIVENQRPHDADPLISEARTLGFDQADILGRLHRSSAEVKRLMPTIRTIVR